jgi:hypothetical protein
VVVESGALAAQEQPITKVRQQHYTLHLRGRVTASCVVSVQAAEQCGVSELVHSDVSLRAREPVFPSHLGAGGKVRLSGHVGRWQTECASALCAEEDCEECHFLMASVSPSSREAEACHVWWVATPVPHTHTHTATRRNQKKCL